MDRKEIASITDDNGIQNHFILQSLISHIPIDKAQDSITCISTYQSNIYIGTLTGEVLHYHKFEDAPNYILISQLNVGNEKIRKILILDVIERAIILSGHTAHIYTIPELSTCRIGKIKEVNDILHLRQLKQNTDTQHPRPPIPNEKVIVFALNKVRLIQFSSDLIKLLKDINYSNAVKGISCSSGTSSNYSNLSIVANETNYDIIDMQQTRKIPLFEYRQNQNDSLEPFLVPFHANDKDPKSEEYLLTVKSDDSTSIAMFINSLGDVTRGTLSWMNEGYPLNGLVIHWPLAIGLFVSPSATNNLVISSLVSLDVKSSTNIETLITPEQDLTKDQTSFDGPNAPTNHKILEINPALPFKNNPLSDMLSISTLIKGDVVSVSEEFSSTSIILHSDDCIYLLYEEEKLVNIYEDSVETIKSILSSESTTEEESNKKFDFHLLSLKVIDTKAKIKFLFHFKLLLMYAAKRFSSLKEILYDENVPESYIDPRLILFLSEKDATNGLMYDDFTVHTGIRELAFSIRDLKYSNEELVYYVLEKSYSLREALEMNQQMITYARTTLYSSRVQNSDDLIKRVDNDKEYWSSFSENQIPIIKYIKEKRLHVGLLYIYLNRQQNIDNKDEHLPIKIFDLVIDLLKKTTRDSELDVEEGTYIKTMGKTFDLVHIAFDTLKNNITDVDTYTKYLLEMLQISPSEGMKYLKCNKQNRHKSTHKNILEEVSKSYSGEIDFTSLKIEYLEASFMEDISLHDSLDLSLLDELLLELTKLLVSASVMNETNIANLGILQETYKIENTFTDSQWPKVSWIDYLQSHSKRSECTELIEYYLKVYEVLLFRVLNNIDHSLKFFKETQNLIKDEESLKVLKFILNDYEISELVISLYNMCDYSSAEFIVVYNVFPLPSRLTYLQNEKQNILKLYHRQPKNDIKTGLTGLFKLYMGTQDNHGKYLAANHFVSAYGCEFFTAKEILGILPEFIPLPYIKEYLSRILIESEMSNRDTTFKKVLSRADAKFSERIHKDFEFTSDL